MKREIKFRAWDKEEKQMISAEDWYFSDEFEPFVHAVERAQEDFELMQFTGLLDKNGKEIYEGDVLEIKSGNFSDKIQMKFEMHAFESAGGHGETGTIQRVLGYKCDDLFGEIQKCYQVIGNIYEHPDLLKG